MERLVKSSSLAYYRDTKIGDGKNTVILEITGKSKASIFYTYIGMGVFILLTGVPCFLLFMMFLDLLYAVLLYTGLFISLLFLFTRFRHHPYFFRHEQLLLTDIRESTLPNPPIQKPDISKL